MLLFGAALPVFGQTTCENIKSLNLPNVTFKSVGSVEAGPFVAGQPAGRGGAAPAAAPAGRGGAPAAGGRGAAPPLMLPAYCRVAMVLAPSSDSHIEMELWLPASDWNGKFQAVGNGGWAGTITFAAMAQALREGYATASNDTGHAGQDPAFGLGHPEKLVDFAYRANHEMTVQSKAIINAFYGKASAGTGTAVPRVEAAGFDGSDEVSDGFRCRDRWRARKLANSSARMGHECGHDGSQERRKMFMRLPGKLKTFR